MKDPKYFPNGFKPHKKKPIRINGVVSKECENTRNRKDLETNGVNNGNVVMVVVMVDKLYQLNFWKYYFFNIFHYIIKKSFFFILQKKTPKKSTHTNVNIVDLQSDNSKISPKTRNNTEKEKQEEDDDDSTINDNWDDVYDENGDLVVDHQLNGLIKSFKSKTKIDKSSEEKLNDEVVFDFKTNLKKKKPIQK